MCSYGSQKTIIIVDDALLFAIMLQLCLCLFLFTKFGRFGFVIVYFNCYLHACSTLHMGLWTLPSIFCHWLFRTQRCGVAPAFPGSEGTGGVQSSIDFQLMPELTEMSNDSCIFTPVETLELPVHTSVYFWAVEEKKPTSDERETPHWKVQAGVKPTTLLLQDDCTSRYSAIAPSLYEWLKLIGQLLNLM